MDQSNPILLRNNLENNEEDKHDISCIICFTPLDI